MLKKISAIVITIVLLISSFSFASAEEVETRPGFVTQPLLFNSNIYNNLFSKSLIMTSYNTSDIYSSFATKWGWSKTQVDDAYGSLLNQYILNFSVVNKNGTITSRRTCESTSPFVVFEDSYNYSIKCTSTAVIYGDTVGGAGGTVANPQSVLTVPKIFDGSNLTVIHSNISSQLVNIHGNPFYFPGDPGSQPVDLGSYRLQSKLELYSNYEYSNYPGTSQLNKFNGWLTDTKALVFPTSSYYKNNLLKRNTGDDALKWYFLSWDNKDLLGPSGTDSQNRFVLTQGYNRYDFCVWNDINNKWVYKSLISSKAIKFIPGVDNGGIISPPKVIIPSGSYAISIEYGDVIVGGSPLDVSPAIMRPIFNQSTLSEPLAEDYDYIESQHYIISDDLIKFNPDDNDNGSIFIDDEGNLTDEDGNPVVETPSNNDDWGLPTTPSGDVSVSGWFTYIFDSIKAFFTGLAQGISDIVGEITNIFKLLGSVFSYLPGGLFSVLSLAVVGIIVLRFLGR